MFSIICYWFNSMDFQLIQSSRRVMKRKNFRHLSIKAEKMNLIDINNEK